MSHVVVVLALLAFVGSGVAIGVTVREVTGSFWAGLGAEGGALAILAASVILVLRRPINRQREAIQEVEEIVTKREA